MITQSVQEAHQRDIKQYYESLKTFFDVTGVLKLNRETSSRAQKARGKLLKLSFSQFYELSTDLADELKRRINEDENKPEFLLPKVNFHVKRNQARQKLANLSQTRFNELVDDILFEIQRRGFDKTIEPTKKANEQENIDDLNNSLPKIVSPSEKDPTSIMKDRNSSSSQIPTTTTSIQPSLVIPKKASIDWSTSEEEESDDEKDKELKETEGKADNTAQHPTADITDIHDDSDLINNTTIQEEFVDGTAFLTPLAKNNRTSNDETETKNRAYGGSTLKEQLESTFDNKPNPSIDIPTPVLSSISRNVFSTELNEPEIKADSNINSTPITIPKGLESNNNIDVSDKNMKYLNSNDSSSTMIHSTSNSSHRQSEFMNLNSQVRNLSIENETLKQKVSELEVESKFRYNITSNELDTTEESDLLSSDSLLKYMSSDGILTLGLVTSLNVQINSFFKIIKRFNNIENSSLGDELFKTLGKTSNIISDILTQVDLPKYKDQVILLKASFSHLISTVRYFSMYHYLLPKLAIYAAITEVAFATCNLISITNIKETNIANVKSQEDLETSNEVNNSLPHGSLASPQPVALDNSIYFTPAVNSVYSNPMDIMEDKNNAAENSPVKPLKITQKIGNQASNFVPKINTRMRQPSGSSLSSLMIDQERHKKSSSDISNMPTTPVPPSIKSSLANEQAVEKKDENRTVLEDDTQKQASTMNTNLSTSIDNSIKSHIETKPKYSEEQLTNQRSSIGLAMSIDNIFGSDDKNDDELIKGNHPISETDLNATPDLIGTSSDSLSKFNVTETEEKPNNRLNNGGEDEDETFLALRQVQENKKIEAEKKNGASDLSTSEAKNPSEKLNVTSDTKSNHSINSINPIKINKLVNASLRKVSLNKVNSNDKNKPTTSASNDSLSNSKLEIPERKKEHVIEKNEVQDTFQRVELPKRHEPRLSNTKGEPTIQVKSESIEPVIKNENDEKTIPKIENDGDEKVTNEPIIEGKKLEQSTSNNVNTREPVVKKEPVIKNETIETPISVVSNHEESTNGNIDFNEDDSSYQFIPLKPTDEKATKATTVSEEEEETDDGETSSSEGDSEEDEDFDVDAFDIENPDNTLSDLLLYLEHQTVDVISTIQSLLSSIKEPQSTKGNLRKESNAINQVIGQMVDATSTSMNQSRNAKLKEHGSWVVRSLEDCGRRMTVLCQLEKGGILKNDETDNDYADKNFKQRLAGIAFDVAKCTKELVKTVEEASLKEEIEFLNSRFH